MSEGAELQEMIQLIRFTGEIGKDMALLLKGGVSLSAKGVEKSKLLAMQIRLKLHFYDFSIINRPYKSLSLRSIEKITGGNYRIVDIPSEDKDELTKYFKQYKKHKIPFAVLPDLNEGDNHIQIAINPQDIDKINDITSIFKFKSCEKIKEIDEVEYYDNATEEKKKEFDEVALKVAEKQEIGLEKEANDVKKKDSANIEEMAKLDMFKRREADSNYEKITIDTETLLLSKTDSHYVTRIPGSYKNGSFLAIEIPKEEAMLSEDKKTIMTFLHKDSESKVFKCGRGENEVIKVDNMKLITKYYSKPFNKKFNGLDKKENLLINKYPVKGLIKK